MNDLNAQLSDKTNMKEVDTKNTQENIAYYSFLRNIMFVTSVILSTFGFVSFLWISKQNFKEKFSIYKFLIGINDSECFKTKNK